MKIVLCADHGGFLLKEYIKKHLSNDKKIEVIDAGTFTDESVDYPDIANDAAKKYKAIHAEYLFSFCGTGVGISIALNKIDGIYCALVYNVESAVLAMEHNGVNALALGGRQLDFDMAKDMIDGFLNAKVLDDSHKRRRAKIGY